MSPASSGVSGHAHPVLAESQLIPWHSPAAAAAPKHSGMSPASSGVSGHVSGSFTSSGGWIDRTGWIGTSRVWQHTCASPAIRLVTWRIPIAFALDRIESPLSGRGRACVPARVEHIIVVRQPWFSGLISWDEMERAVGGWDESGIREVIRPRPCEDVST